MIKYLLLVLVISTVAEGNVSHLTSWTKNLPRRLVAGVAILATCGTLACQRDGVRVRRHYLDREIRDLADGRRRALGIRSSAVNSFQRQTHDATFYDGMAVHLQIDEKSFIGRVTSDQEKISTVSVDIFATPDNIEIDLQQISGVLVATFGKQRITDVKQITTFVNGMPIIITNHDLLLEKGATVSVDSSETQILDSHLLRFNEQLSNNQALDAMRFDGIEYLHFSDNYRVIRVTVIIDQQKHDYQLQDDEIMFVIAHDSVITQHQ